MTKTGGGTFTVSGAITMTGGHITVNGGRLNLLAINSGINASSVLTVNGAGTSVHVGTLQSTSGIGSASVVLNGGTLQFDQLTPVLGNGFVEKIIQGTIGDARTDISTFLTANIAATDGQGLLNGQINYPDAGSVTTRVTALGGVGFNNNTWSAIWTTDFTPATSGDWTFGFDAEDDNSSIWIDLNNDGVFQLSDRIEQRSCCGGDTSAIATLNAGQTYHMAFLSGNTGGAGNFANIVATPPGSGATSFDPTNFTLVAIENTTTSAIQFPATLSNPVSLTASSSIVMGTGLPSVALGALTTSPSVILTVDSLNANGSQTLSFSSVSTGGDLTLNTIDNSQLKLSSLVQTATTALTKTGNGTLTLATSNTYTGLTTVNAGGLNVGADGALGSAAAGTILNGSGQLALRANYLTAEPLTLNGNSVAAVMESNGAFTFAGPISLSTDATIQVTASTLTLSGGVTSNGHQLTKTGAGAMTIATAGFTGAGSLKVVAGDVNLSVANSFSGGTDIQNGGRVLFAVDSGTALVHVESGGSLIYTGLTDLVDTVPITIDSGGNIASRSAVLTVPAATLPFSGTLIVNNDTVNDNFVVFPNAAALTSDFQVQVGGGAGNGGTALFSNTISGGFGFVKTGNGVLALGGNNTYTGTNHVNGGVLAAASPNGFGATTNGTIAISGASVGLLSAPALGFPDFTLNVAEPLTFVGAGAGGIGALVNLQGNNTFSSLIPAIQDALSIGSVAGTLNLTSALATTDTLTFTGAGNIIVTGNVTSVAQKTYGFVGFTGGTGAANSTQDILNWTYTSATTNINQSAGFASNGLTLNGSAAVGSTNNPNALTVTNSQNSQAGSAWQAVTPSGTGAFTSHFQFQFSGLGGGGADGFTFTAQNIGLNALGAGGGGLGYQGIGNSVSVQYNLWQNVSTFGIGRNGADPGTSKLQVDLTQAPYNFNFHSDPSDVFESIVVYNGDQTGHVDVWDATLDAAGTNRYTLQFDLRPTTVVKAGTGTTTLSGTNTYVGDTIVNAGVLSVTSNGALGTTAKGTTVNSGGTLQFNGVNYSTQEKVTMQGTGAGGIGAVAGFGTSTFAGTDQ